LSNGIANCVVHEGGVGGHGVLAIFWIQLYEKGRSSTNTTKRTSVSFLLLKLENIKSLLSKKK